MKKVLVLMGVVSALAGGCREDEAACDDPGAGDASTGLTKTPTGPLRILLTNDDGWNSPGITAMRSALVAAGYDVTLVAPLDPQSGMGGSLRTDVGGAATITEESPGVYSVDGSPADSVRAALGAVMHDAPPNLVISGINFGQNLADPGISQSGTINAALVGVFRGIPAVAVSLGLKFSEAGSQFPSTIAGFAPAASMTVDLVREIEADDAIVPAGSWLNVNIPVPVDAIVGWRTTRPASEAEFDFVWSRTNATTATIGVALATTPDPLEDADTTWFRMGYVSVSPIRGYLPTPTATFAERLAGFAVAP